MLIRKRITPSPIRKTTTECSVQYQKLIGMIKCKTKEKKIFEIQNRDKNTSWITRVKFIYNT